MASLIKSLDCIFLLLFSLLTSAAGSLDQFYNPPSPADVFSNPVWPLGTVQTIVWSTTTEETYTIILWQHDLKTGALYPITNITLISSGSGSQSFAWPVSIKLNDLDLFPEYRFQLKSVSRDFTSCFFNISVANTASSTSYRAASTTLSTFILASSSSISSISSIFSISSVSSTISISSVSSISTTTSIPTITNNPNSSFNSSKLSNEGSLMLNGGAIAGIVIGAAVLLCMFFIVYQRKELKRWLKKRIEILRRKLASETLGRDGGKDHIVLSQFSTEKASEEINAVGEPSRDDVDAWSMIEEVDSKGRWIGWRSAG